MNYRFGMIMRWVFVIGILIGLIAQPQYPAFAATTLTVTPISWNIIGLDSNNVNAGPNDFPVGARVCNTGAAVAANVTATFVWDSANLLINNRPGTNTTLSVSSLAIGACTDFYFEVEVTRNAAAYNTTRSYHISVTADAGATTGSTLTPREIFVEHLVSQSRNAVTNVLLDGVSIAPGGTMTLLVGQTYTIQLVGYTATQGYEQIEYFINFPNTIFQILSATSTFTADTSATVSSPNDKLYGDNCVWENDPNSPNYRACNSTGKTGGNITVTYQVRILQVPGAPLINPEPLSTLIYDFSGSSYHYNSDYGVSTRYAYVLDPSAVTIAKNFSPDPTSVSGISTLTFTLTNPTPVTLTGLNFTDTLPTSPGAMVVAGVQNASTSGCGSPIFAPAAAATSITFSNGTLAPNSSCAITVNVTVPVVGTYTNTSNNLFIGTIDTGNSATDTLTVNSSPPSPSAVCGLSLAMWDFPSGFNTASPAPTTSSVTSSASPGAGIVSVDSTQNNSGVTHSWGSDGGFATGVTLTTTNNDYFEFAINTTNVSSVDLNFAARRTNNGPQSLAVYYGTSATPPGSSFTYTWPVGFLGAQNTWYSSGTLTFSSGLNASGTTYFRIYGFNSSNTNPGSDLYLDDVTFTGCAVPNPPTITKAFSPSPIAVNGTSTLTFTLANSNSIALTGVTFTDSLLTGLQVASTPSAATTCTVLPTWSPAAGATSLTFGSPLGATILANSSCTVSVSITGTASGSYQNVSGFISSTNGGTNTGSTGSASASLIVLKPPVISKLFAPNPILTNGTSTLTFTLTNPNQNDSLTGLAFTDTFPVAPGAMTVASPLTTTNTCGGALQDNAGGVLAAADPGIRLTGGTLTGGSACTVTVNVTAAAVGSYANTSGAVSSTNSGTGNTASDTLSLNAPSPAIALLKQVSTSATGPWTNFVAVTAGTNVYYQFTIENAGDVALTSVSISDPSLPSAATTCNSTWTNPLPVAVAGNDNHIDTCVVGPVTAVSGSHLNTATASGVYSSATYTDTSSATYATTGLTIAKSVTETSFLVAGDLLHYSYLVTNSGSAPLLGPVTVTDNKATVTCPAVSTVGDLDLYLDPGESLTCTAIYTVVPADTAAAAGFVTNTASASANSVTSNTDSRTINQLRSDLTVTKSNNVSGSVAQSSSFNWTINVNNAGTAAASFADTNVIMSDALPGADGYYTLGPLIVTPGGTAPTGTISCSIVSGPSLSCAASGAVTLPIGASFSVAFAVTPTSAGALANTATVDLGGNIIESDETNNTGSNTVTVVAPPSISKAFGASSIALNGTTTLSFTITDPNTGTALTGVAFTDTLPAGLLVATPNGLTGSCGGGTITAMAGSSTVSLAGATLAASASCVFSVNVLGSTGGTKTNSVAATSTNGGTGNTSTANLGVISAAKSVIATSEDSSSEVGAPRNVLIGEIVRYHLVIDLPEGTTTNLQVIDSVVTNMAFMNDGSTRVAFVCNSGASCASSSTAAIGTNPVISGNANSVTPTFVLPAASITGGAGNPYGDGVDPTFSLGNITNNDSDSDAEYVVIEFNSLVRNTAANQDGSTRGNTFTVNVGGSALISTTSAAGNQVTIIEPVISAITKSVTTTPTDAGDTIIYQLQFTNTGNAPAFDIAITDALNSVLTTPVSVSGSTTGGACGSTASSVSGSYSAPNVTATVTCLAAGGIATINISATVSNTALTGFAFSNSASLAYTSLPGTGTAGNPTGSTTPGASGATTGERDGSGGVRNDYTSTSNTVNTTLASPSLAKTINPAGTTYAIGATIPYQITITVPEGVTGGPTANLIDTIPTGLSYVSGSLTVTPQAGVTISAAGPYTDANATFFNLTGQTLTLTFGSFTSTASASAVNRTILVSFNAQVNNVVGNQSGTSFTNSVDFTRTNPNGAGTVTISASSPSASVIEPDLNVSKVVSTSTPAYNSTLTYTLTLGHTGASNAPAYDTVITDTMPAGLTGLTNVNVSSTAPASCATGVVNNSTASALSVTVGTIPLGCAVTITYDVTISGAVASTQTNSVNTAWTSGSGPVPGERTGADGVGGALNDYADTASQPVTISGADFRTVKTDGSATYTPGTSIAYTITVNNDGNSTATGTVTDTFPAPLTSVSWTCAGTGGATCSASGSGNISDPVSIPVGQSVTYTVNATVPSSATGSLANTAMATMSSGTDPTPGNNSSTDTDTPSYVADLEVIKTDGTAIVQSGGTTTYTIVVINHGPSDANNTVFADPSVTGLSATAVTCGSATGGAACPTVAATTVALMQGAGIVIPTLPSGGSVTFTVNMTVTATSGSVANVATVAPTAGTADPGTFPNTATDTDTVIEIVALNDTGSTVSGTAGGQSLADVLTNDTLNGNPATLANVNLTQVSTTNPGVTLDVTTGAVNVVAGTAAGNYTVTYQICDQANPTICDTATVSVPVITIDAVNDAGSLVNGTVGGQSLVDVLTNDTLNGSPATLANVNLIQVSTTNPGVTLDVTTGAVNVAAGTPAGNYTVTYQICDQANPAICDSATVSVPVVTINAVNDTGSTVNGTAGGQSLADVLTNDTLNGNPATLANVNLTQVSTTNPGVTLDVTTGAVNVAAGTAAGNYTVTYQICDQANPTICDTATVSVPVIVIDAVNDSGSTVNGTTGGQSLADVLVNDTLNGNPATLVTITLTQVSTTNPGVTLDVTTGAVNVAAGTTAGNYTVTYQICDQANSTICDMATVSVPIIVIDAVNDTGSTVNGTTGGQSLADVLANDTLNGNPTTLANVNLTQVSTTNPGVTLDVTAGAINVAPGTPAGNYTVTYQICDQVNPTICDTATVSVPVVVINAVNDTGSTVDGTVGGQSLADVLTNDTLNGNPATLANVTLAQVSTTDPGVTLDVTTGAVNVAPGTPAGNYTVTYQICDQANPTICDSATVSVPIVTIDAVNDAGSTVNGTAGGQSLVDVLVNDTLNGNPATLANVNLTQVSTTNPGVTLDVTTGAVNVAVGTAAGNYTVTYQICDQANPTICDTATVSVPVIVIDAVNDTGSTVNGTTGGQSLADVLTNDTLNGNPATLATITLTQVSTTNSGVTLDVTTGAVHVAAGTAAGTYTVTYEICDQANPTVCDTATVSVPVIVIDAVNDSGSTVNGTAGGQSLANVLTNDTLNGNPATLATIALTQVSTTNPGVTLDVTTGAINVAVGTPAGNYTVTYQICDQVNPTFCDTAIVSVPVVAINAVNDIGSTVNGTTGGQSFADVLVNDTLNGNPATLANISLTQVSTTNPGVTLDVTTGAVNVAAGTAAGNYTVTYQICDQANPAICDTATVSVPVSAAPIVAVDDIATGVNGVTGAIGVLNVFNNDTLNGVAIVPSDVTLTETVPDPSGALTLNPDGSVDVAPGTAAGTYQLTYSICEVLNPTNCDTAMARVTVGLPAAPIAQDDSTTTPFNTQVTLTDITANDTAFGAGNSILINTIDLDPSTAGQQTSFTDASGNQWSVNTTTGDVTFTPAANYTGIATIPYSVQDAAAQTAAANLSVTVGPPASISGVVFNDLDLNGLQTGSEPGITGVTVNLYDGTGTTLIATVTTGAGGTYNFPNLSAGDYIVVETDLAGYVSSTSNSVPATIIAGGSATVNFGDYRLPNTTLSAITGTVFNDANGNGTMDAGETALSGVTVELRNNVGAVIATTTTNATGGYSFTSLPAGTYTITETDPVGYISTTLNNVGVNLSAGTNATINFGDQTSGAAIIADPAVTKFGSPTSASVGTAVVYTITVGNNGNANATNVVLTDTKPAFLDIISITISPNPGLTPVISGNTFTINFGIVAPTDSYVITVLTRVNSLGQPPGGSNNVSIITNSVTDRLFNNTSVAALQIVSSGGGGAGNNLRASALPNTGFAPNVVTSVGAQPEDMNYTATDVLLEIPSLGVKIPVVGVPFKDREWNVSWLGKKAGWLEGSAFPSWDGNSVLTSHVYLSNGLPGPFVNLNKLKFGDRIVVHAYGQKYIFDVQTNVVVEANNKTIFKHEEKSWLTLVTCKEYDEKTKTYRKRVVVRAVLVKVEVDK